MNLQCTDMGHVMRKPVYTLCEQQRCRSACTSVQSDQHLCCPWPDSIIPILAKSKISRLQLVCVAEQAGLSLTNPKDRFSCDVAHMTDISRSWANPTKTCIHFRENRSACSSMLSDQAAVPTKKLYGSFTTHRACCESWSSSLLVLIIFSSPVRGHHF